MVLALGIIGFSSEARTKNLYAQKPVFSVLGDSISSYSTYNEGLPCYGPGAAYNIDKGKMWWSIYCNGSGNVMGWSASTGCAQITNDESDILSFFYPSRLNNLDNNGTPDYIAVYGGTNDDNDAKSASLFYTKYNQLVNKLHSLFDGVKLILMAPNYLPEKMDPTSSKKTLANTYANYINSIATNNGDYYVDLRGIYGKNDTVDELHPNETGMQKIADAVNTALSTKRGKTTGIESIRADFDYDHYIIKVNAYDPNYDSLNFKFKLTSSSGEVIYDTGWQKNNCFYLDEVNPRITYTADVEIDNNNDGIYEDTMTKSFSNLVSKRTGGSIYNGVDYSAVYDFNYYVEHNSDLYAVYRNDPYSALQHFMNYGMNEGRQANAVFDVKSYRNRYQDIRQVYGWNNLKAYYDHYRLYGKNEGRNALNCPTLQNGLHTFFGVDFSPVYDYNYYIKNNPDVYNAYNGDETQVFIHFLTAGMKEGRRACEGFDVYSYRNLCSDLRQTYGWNNLQEYYLHYVNYGVKEKRTAVGCDTLQNPIHSFLGVDFSPVYDYNYYTEHNADVRDAFKGDDLATFVHFLAYGCREGRQGSETFNVWTYANNNPDLVNVYFFDLASYYLHYINWGKKEGRVAV